MSGKSCHPKPLRNLNVLVGCSAKKIASLQTGLEALGARVLAIPLIEAGEIHDNQALDGAIDSLEEYTWILFTSAHAVVFFMQRLIQRISPKDILNMPKICAIGPATAEAAKEYGLRVELVPERFAAEGVLDALAAYHNGLERMAGCRVLFPRAKEAREILPEMLSKAGVCIDVIPCYETVNAQLDENTVRQIRSIELDLIVFTSSSAVRALIDLLGREDGVRLLLNSTVAVIGPVTGHTSESFGKKPEIIPDQSTIAALIDAIRRYYSQK